MVLVGMIIFVGLMIFYMVCWLVGVNYCNSMLLMLIFGVILIVGVDLIVWLVNLLYEMFFGIIIFLIGVLCFIYFV